jgi:hypothetical protein
VDMYQDNNIQPVRRGCVKVLGEGGTCLALVNSPSMSLRSTKWRLLVCQLEEEANGM